MTQSELIEKLNDLMPEIISTRNPEATMLKCARQNNFSPALLERLGQVFNTTKTLWGLEKSANRGDSFSLVDVPAMLESYKTYSPETELTGKAERAQRQAEKITKAAEVGRYSNIDNWCDGSSNGFAGGIQCGGGIENLHQMLFSHSDWEMHDANEDEWKELPLGKVASAEPVARKADWELAAEKEEARRNVECAYNQSAQYLFVKCADVRNALYGKMEKWAEACEDIYDTYKEDGLGVIETIETHFRNNGIHFEPIDLQKRACVRALSQDRHGILKIAGEMVEALKVYQEAEELLMEKKAGPTINPQALVGTVAKGIRDRLTLRPDRFDPTTGKVLDTLTFNDLDPAEYALAKKWYEDEMKEPDPDGGVPLHLPSDKTDKAKGIGDSISEGAKDLVTTMKMTHGIVPDLAPTAKGMISDYKNLVNEFRPRTDERAKALDAAKDLAATNTTLQSLLLSDPILQEADPSRVQTLFHAISKISPTLAKSPELMGPALKEALQYDALPVQLLTSYANLEKSLMESDEKAMKLNQMKY